MKPDAAREPEPLSPGRGAEAEGRGAAQPPGGEVPGGEHLAAAEAVELFEEKRCRFVESVART